MNRLKLFGFVAASSAAATLAMAAPADAAAATKPTGTIKAIARPCVTPRVAHFRIALRHLVAGKVYTVEWSAPNRSGGTQITQIPFNATGARYTVADVASRAATPLLARSFTSTVQLLVDRKAGAVEVMQTTTVVPRCTPRR